MTPQSTKDVLRQPRRRSIVHTGRVSLLVGAAALAVSLASAGVSSASAAPARMQPAHIATPKTTNPVEVKIGSRPSVGDILVVEKGGATLYTASSCTGSCLSVWPPLELPSGATKPRGAKGVKGLGTIKIAGGKLQITYMKHPLYTFVDDSGHSVNGNGVNGFSVLTVPAPA
jgi:predicted lipoprotein with Yx(FWY)xxD motif